MKIRRWEQDKEINLSEMKNQLENEGLSSFLWQDDIGTFYPAHTHSYTEVRWIVSGSITFGVNGEEVTLYSGDRLELPANTSHYAKMSDETSTSYLCASINDFS